MKYIALTFILAGLFNYPISTEVLAQGRTLFGFMGKKNVVSYAGIITPNISKPNYAGNQGITALATRHELSYQRIIGRGQMLGLSVNIFRTRVEGEGTLYSRYAKGFDAFSSQAFPAIGLINGQMVSLKYCYMAKRLHQGARHKPSFPIGPYVELGATYFRAELTDGSPYQSIQNAHFYGLGFSIEPGIQRVLYQRLLLKIGYQYFLTQPFGLFGAIFGMGSDDSEFNHKINYYQNTNEYATVVDDSGSNLNNIVKKRISDQYLLGLRLSLGYLF